MKPDLAPDHPACPFENVDEAAEKHHEQIGQLIAPKEYQLIRTVQKRHRKAYVYRFTLDGGRQLDVGFFVPLGTTTPTRSPSTTDQPPSSATVAANR